MALVLVRLRLALQHGGRARHGAGGTAWFVIGWMTAVIAGLAGGTLVAAFDSQNTAAGDMIAFLILTAVFLSWILTPVLLPGVGGDAIDPSKLEQFPLSHAEQIGGLLLGGLVAPTAVGTFLVAAGATAATGFDVPTRIVAGLGAVLYVVLCVSVSASVRALFAAALESRRGRDVAVVISGLIAVGVFLVIETSTTTFRSAEAAAGLVRDVLSWAPPGATAAVGIELRNGDVLTAGVRALIVVATIGLALFGWAWALGRHVNGGGASTHASTRRVRGDLTLVPRLLHGARGSVALAAASQQLRYFFFRSPRAVQLVTITPLFGIVIGATQTGSNPLTVSMAITALVVAFGGVTNVFGYDGVGIEATIQTGASLRDVLKGKLVAAVAYLIPLMTVIVIVFALVFDRENEVFAALVAAYSTVMIMVAVGAWSSVWNPFDVSRAADRAAQLPRVFGILAIALAFVIVGAAIWFVLATVVPESVAALVLLALSGATAAAALRVFGRRLDRDPSSLITALTA